MNSFQSKKNIEIGGKEYTIYDLKKLEEKGLANLSKLPFSIRVLLENLLRNENGKTTTESDVKALAAWNAKEKSDQEIAYTPARVILQDFTGVPAVVDLAAMRDAISKMGGDPESINPLQPADLVIDHSVQVDNFGTEDSVEKNMKTEYSRNQERYEFLKWGQQAFENFRVVPPGMGIVHQVNLEYLAKVVFTKEVGGETLAYPDTLVGTDSHTTMINGLGVLGWGVGGIEAEAAMLGQTVSMLIPQVVGFKLTGKLKEGRTATDLVLTVVEMLRAKGVVGKFVEFFGEGLKELSLADRATIANMAPEYGATMGFFPVDHRVIEYLKLTGRGEQSKLVEGYLKAQGLFLEADSPEPEFSDLLELNMDEVEASISGPKRPQDRILLSGASQAFEETLQKMIPDEKQRTAETGVSFQGSDFQLKNGSVVIAAITSCTNTSNPSVMLGAGLVAKKALERGLQTKPWVKTSLAPGSRVVMRYLKESGLEEPLKKLRFNNVGFGCTTCIGNSGPLPAPIAAVVEDKDLLVASVLSGNRNFEGRVNPHVKANYLASPPLVVAYAIAGSMEVDFEKDSLGKDKDGQDVYLKDIWPSGAEVTEALLSVGSEMFESEYAHVFEGDDAWKALEAPQGSTFDWKADSTYVKNPPYFENMPKEPGALSNIHGARVLAMLGDSVTTDHISPAGAIPKVSPAADYLKANGVEPKDFNSFGSRRGNHEVMMRGTFANIRLRNLLAPGTEGGYTRHLPYGEQMFIYDAAMKYKFEGIPSIILAGKEYGSGSSRDWAGKGPALLGVKAVIAESYERIHRSNLVGMGVLPLQFLEGQSPQTLGLTGEEVFDIDGVESIKPGDQIQVKADQKVFHVVCRIDTPIELEYYRHGGILQYVLRQLLNQKAPV